MTRRFLRFVRAWGAVSLAAALVSPARAERKTDGGGARTKAATQVVYPANDLQPDLSFLFERALEARQLLAIKRVLLDDARYPRCQMVVEPSDRSPEHEVLVYLTRSGESAEIVTRKARRSVVDLSGDADKAGTTPEAAERAWASQIETRKAQLDPEVADVLEQVWEVALDRVRDPVRPFKVFHPTYYRFGHWDNEHTFRSGFTIGVDPDQVPAIDVAAPNVESHLRQVGWAMIRYARADAKGQPNAKAALEKQARALLERFRFLGHAPPPVKERRAHAAQ